MTDPPTISGTIPMPTDPTRDALREAIDTALATAFSMTDHRALPAIGDGLYAALATPDPAPAADELREAVIVAARNLNLTTSETPEPDPLSDLDDALQALDSYVATPDPVPAHRPEWMNDAPTGWCECGQPNGHAVPNVDCTSDPAPALDVETLVRAMEKADPAISPTDAIELTHVHRAFAHAIATEYARLTPSPQEENK